LNIPFGPLTSIAVLGTSFTLPRVCVCGRSMNFSETSGGIDTGVLPMRDCAGEVVEKHCARRGCENAGTRKAGSELLLTGPRRSCLKQLRDTAQDMVGGNSLFDCTVPRGLDLESRFCPEI